MNGRSTAPVSKALLYTGLLAYPLFFGTVLVQGFVRTGYSPLRFPLSSLAIGGSGWIQICNFLVAGMMIVIFSFAVKKMLKPATGKFRGPWLIRLVGIGLMGAGAFVTDAVYGYPLDQPLAVAQFTWHGHLHDAFSMLVFVCLPWACFSVGRRLRMLGEKSWARYSTFSGFAMITFFVITSLGFKQIPFFVDYSGLFQRISISFGGVWISALAYLCIRKGAVFPA